MPTVRRGLTRKRLHVMHYRRSASAVMVHHGGHHCTLRSQNVARLQPCSTIKSAAKALSEELYSKDDHVVLELVQNADDCSYETGVAPTLAILVFKDGLLFATNEQGFNERNVTAICDLDNSSKSRSLGAYTGEKGKPYFLVCCSLWYRSVGFICCDSSQALMVHSQWQRLGCGCGTVVCQERGSRAQILKPRCTAP